MDEQQKEWHSFYLKTFQEEAKNRSEQYIVTARKSIALPLIVNAAASTALVNFFTQSERPSLINIAAIFFVSGAVFGILTLVFEFFAAYFSYLNFKVTLSEVSQAESHEAQLDILDKHYKLLRKEMESTAKIALFEIICGSISILLGLVGIYCIVIYITDSYCLVSIIFSLLAIGSMVSTWWIRRIFMRLRG